MKNDFLNRNVNEGFSGGERKRNEILQLAVIFLTCHNVLMGYNIQITIMLFDMRSCCTLCVL